MDIVSTNVTKSIPANVTNTMSSNFYEKVRYKKNCYILQRVLLVIMLLLIIVIICCHYKKHSPKLKIILPC